jgi:hypothetical protein
MGNGSGLKSLIFCWCFALLKLTSAIQVANCDDCYTRIQVKMGLQIELFCGSCIHGTVTCWFIPMGKMMRHSPGQHQRSDQLIGIIIRLCIRKLFRSPVRKFILRAVVLILWTGHIAGQGNCHTRSKLVQPSNH